MVLWKGRDGIFFTAVDISKVGTVDGHGPDLGLDAHGQDMVIFVPVVLDSSSTAIHGGSTFVQHHEVI
jgi:hypothetical protein